MTTRMIRKAPVPVEGVASCGCWKISYVVDLTYHRRNSRGKWERVTTSRRLCEKHGQRFMKRYGLKVEAA